MRKVEKIACSNAAGFVMNFSIRWMDTDGLWHTTDWNSGNYPIDQTRTSPSLSSIGVPTDAVAVTPYVHAILGKHQQGTPAVQAADNGQVGTYNVTGTTLDFHVKLN
ncbi:MAG: hypothetical protein D6692_04640 [Planctomycetota bacterium]|nr:MAG: hypothetical protein D6692_04640 [Planctomycetota bacterium]